MSDTKTVALCMIVKNEAHVIERCIDSVLPLIDLIYICDTGSTDGTPDLIFEYAVKHDILAHVDYDSWVNFGANRTRAIESLRACAPDIDYVLMIDADEVLVFEKGFDARCFKDQLYHSAYNVRSVLFGSEYNRPQLFSNKLPFKFTGVIHEYLDYSEPVDYGKVTAFYNTPIQDGGRSKDPEKYKNDARLLEEALTLESDPLLIIRYTYYLAQSYRCYGAFHKALHYYELRSKMAGWTEETYISLLAIAQLKEKIRDLYADEQIALQGVSFTVEDILSSYLYAYNYMPSRIEAIYGAIRLCRLNDWHNLGYLLASGVINQPYIVDGLLVDAWIYDYALLDEFSIVAYWAGKYQESLDASLKLLHSSVTPTDYLPRVTENAQYAIEKLNRPELKRYLPK